MEIKQRKHVEEDVRKECQFVLNDLVSKVERLSCTDIETVLYDNNGGLSPMQWHETDGSGDNHVKNQKIMALAEILFRVLDLDFLGLSITPSGQSKYNFIERSMAPLTKKLCGVRIEHDVCGKYLDASHNIIDEVICGANFSR